jgi:hypothetical protein
MGLIAAGGLQNVGYDLSIDDAFPAGVVQFLCG